MDTIAPIEATPDMAETRRLRAIARAHEVFDCLDRIDALRRHLRQVLANHDPVQPHLAQRRDVAAFWGRLDELGLTREARREAGRVRGRDDDGNTP